MILRTLLVVATFFLVCAALRGTWDYPQDAQSFVEVLKDMGRKPGPLGYFNPMYMAFTLEEAENFPNLGALHLEMMQMKTTGAHGTLSVENTSKRRRRKRQNTGYPQNCTDKIGGLDKLCTSCSFRTHLGDDIIPPYINEELCQTPDGACDVGNVKGKCLGAVVEQDFLRKTSEEFYLQPIRVCCMCGIYPS